MTMLIVRVPEALAEEAQRVSDGLGIDRSELLREALRRYLLRLRSEQEVTTWERQPLTEAESSLAQTAEWGPADDWSDWADAPR